VTDTNGSAAVDRVLITWSPESCQSAGMWIDAVLNLSMSSITRVRHTVTLNVVRGIRIAWLVVGALRPVCLGWLACKQWPEIWCHLRKVFDVRWPWPWSLTFWVKIGTPVTAALKNVRTKFGFSTPFVFEWGSVTGQREREREKLYLPQNNTNTVMQRATKNDNVAGCQKRLSPIKLAILQNRQIR